MRQKTCCASESNTSVRFVFAIWSGFKAPIGVVLAWEERGSCLNIFRTTNHGRILETFTNYEAKDLLRNESNTSVRVVFGNGSGFDAPIGVVLAWEERGSCLNIFRTTNRDRNLEAFTNYEAKDLLRKRQIAVGSQNHSRITWRKTCCTSESNTSVRVVFANLSATNRSRISETLTNYEAKDLLRNESNTSVRVVFANQSGFDAPIGVVLAWEERGIMSYHIPDDESRLDIRNLHELRGKRLVVQVTQTRRFALYLRTGVVLMVQLESSWHGRSVDHVLRYFGRQIAVGSQKPSRITRQKTRCASESNTSVRVVFANRSGFDAPIGVVLAWEERGSCLNIFQRANRGRISETFTNYEAKDLLRKRQIAVGSQKPSRVTRQKTYCASESNTSVLVVFANRSIFDAPIGVVLAWEERGSCLNIFRTTNRGRISETFMNYEAKDLLSKRKIAVGSQKPSRVTRQKTCCAGESNMSVLVVFANRSGFDAPIGVFLVWDERGSCLNIFRTRNHGRILETLTNYEVKDLLRKVVLAWEERGSCHNLFWTTNCGRILETVTNYEQNTCCASESNASVRVVFANQSGFDAPIGVFLAWKVRGSCLNIFRMTNRGRISETFMNYEAKDLLRKNFHELRGKRIVAQVSQTRRFALYLRTGVVLMLQFESSWHGRSVDHVLTYSRRKIAVLSQKPSRITRQKTCCASESNTSVRVVFANRCDFDAPIGVVLAWEERGSCLNIFQMRNCGRISETFTNYEAKDLLRRNLHELRGKRLVEQVSQTRRSALYFANRSDFDAPIGVVLTWEEHGSSLNIFRTTNRCRISKNFTNSEAKDLFRNPDDKSRSGLKILHELQGKRLVAQVSQARQFAFYLRTGVVLMLQLESSWHGRSVDHDLTYFRREIAVESQKPSRISRQKTCCAVGSQKHSRITRQKTCCASESNTSVRVVFANRSGFDAPIGVFLAWKAWEERGSCLKLFRTTNCCRILETFTNYEQNTCCANESNTSVRIVFANRSGFDAPIGVFLAWKVRGSCLNIFWRTNRGRISETFMNYEAKDLLCRREIVVGSQKTLRLTRQKTCCASESNTLVRVVFANRSGFDAPIGVVLAWEDRGSCLNIFQTTNRGRISKTFTNYEAKDLLRK
ncbi:uncharacterized protein G2W53_026238 [Senna tora]|uniref:Uncharacterized protein n=1 Tax=Senna tora TaxID=362788 RepID=A0A834TEP4_9FABA|nr:uncharacterized protein G2W53_026238 [Senna tora]